jgi:hypothetical protein
MNDNILIYACGLGALVVGLFFLNGKEEKKSHKSKGIRPKKIITKEDSDSDSESEEPPKPKPKPKIKPRVNKEVKKETKKETKEETKEESKAE